MDNFTVASCPLKQHSERIWNMTSKCRPWLGSFDNSEPKKPQINCGKFTGHFFFTMKPAYNLFYSRFSYRPGHVTRFQVPYGTGEIDSLNRLNVIQIRSAVQWHCVFVFFFPFFIRHARKISAYSTVPYVFRQFLRLCYCWMSFLVTFWHVFWSNSSFFQARNCFVIQ